MEGVRAVGLDPCFAMSAVYESIRDEVNSGSQSTRNYGRIDSSISKRDKELALQKYVYELLFTKVVNIANAFVV